VRLILSDDGQFALQYAGRREIRGTYAYSRANNTVALDFGQGKATGSINDDALTLSFDSAMQLAEFEDVSFIRVP
jgi:hypothetical protein